MVEKDILLTRVSDLGQVPRDELERRLKQHGGDAFSLLLHLEEEFPLDKEKLGRIWADTLGVAYVNLETTVVQREAVQRIPEKFARANCVAPLYELDGVLTLAAASPTDQTLTSRVQDMIAGPTSLVFAFPAEIEDAIALAYQTQENLQALVESGIALLDSRPETVTSETLREVAGEKPIIDFVNGLLLLAMNEKASDVHIDPSDTGVRIRFRVDGALQDRLTLERPLLEPLVSRLKILAGGDISQRRRPQDGRFTFELSRLRVDVRFSCIPTIYGEKVVLRLLGRSQKLGVPDLEDLQLSRTIRRSVEKVISAPCGIFFLTGPTGCGKTTTLYSILKRINSPEINILTIEDPVEYRLERINQVQVNPGVELDFANALRAFLRQDPDVILLGEVRDLESAKIAAQAALTGHLVLATLHTNNALQAVVRLMEIGVDPFLVAPSLIAVMAQRLVRRICESCKVRYPAPAEVMEENFIWDGETQVFLYRGEGCDNCHHTGYSGRLGIHELFVINKEVRHLIAREASILEIETAAREDGFRPLRYDGLKKVLRGLTTLQEIEKASYSEA